MLSSFAFSHVLVFSVIGFSLLLFLYDCIHSLDPFFLPLGEAKACDLLWYPLTCCGQRRSSLVGVRMEQKSQSKFLPWPGLGPRKSNFVVQHATARSPSIQSPKLQRGAPNSNEELPEGKTSAWKIRSRERGEAQAERHFKSISLPLRLRLLKVEVPTTKKARFCWAEVTVIVIKYLYSAIFNKGAHSCLSWTMFDKTNKHPLTSQGSSKLVHDRYMHSGH